MGKVKGKFEFEGVVIPTDVYLVALEGGTQPLELITIGDPFPVKAIDSEIPCFKPTGDYCPYSECRWRKGERCQAPRYKVKILVEYEEVREDGGRG